MKKRISFLLAIIICVFFVSCENTNQNEHIDYINDRYLYQLIPSSNGSNIIVKFDIIEKIAVPACPDPICNHREDCPVSGVSNIYVTKNCIYIEKGSIFNGFKLYVYDLAKNEIILLTEGRQFSDPIETMDGIVYFTISHLEYDKTGKVQSEVFHLYKRNEKTGQFAQVSSEPLAGFAILKYYDEEILVWSLVGEKGFCSTNYDFQNKKPYEFPEKDISIDFDTIYTGTLRHDMYRINNETGEKTYIFKDAISFNYVDMRENNVVLYMPSKEIIDGENTKYLPTRNIVYVDAYDDSITYTWEIPTGIAISHLYSEIANRRELGNYIGIECYKSETDSKGNKYRSHGIFVVNPVTKESFTIIYEDSKQLIHSAS